MKPLIGSEWSTGAKDVINTLVIEKSVIVTLPADFTNTVTSDVTEDRVVTSIVLEEEEGKEGVNVAESLKSSKVIILSVMCSSSLVSLDIAFKSYMSGCQMIC